MNNADPNGHVGLVGGLIGAVSGGAIGGLAYGVETFGTGDFTLGGLAANMAEGAVVGAAIGSGVGLVSTMAIGAAANVVEDTVTAAVSEEGLVSLTDGVELGEDGYLAELGEFTVESVATGAASVALGGVINGQVAGPTGKAVGEWAESTFVTEGARTAVAAAAPQIGEVVEGMVAPTLGRAVSELLGAADNTQPPDQDPSTADSDKDNTGLH